LVGFPTCTEAHDMPSARQILMQKMRGDRSRDAEERRTAGIGIQFGMNVRELEKLQRKESKDKRKEDNLKDKDNADVLEANHEARFSYRLDPKMQFSRDYEMPSPQFKNIEGQSKEREAAIIKNIEAVMEHASVGISAATEAMAKSDFNQRKAVQFLASQKSAIAAAEKKVIEEIEKRKQEHRDRVRVEKQEALDRKARSCAKVRLRSICAYVTRLV